MSDPNLRLTPRLVPDLDTRLRLRLAPAVPARLGRPVASGFGPSQTPQLALRLAVLFVRWFARLLAAGVGTLLDCILTAALGLWLTTGVTPSTTCGVPFSLAPLYVVGWRGFTHSQQRAFTHRLWSQPSAAWPVLTSFFCALPLPVVN